MSRISRTHSTPRIWQAVVPDCPGTTAAIHISEAFMLIMRNASEVERITHPAIRHLASLRFRQLDSPEDPDAPSAVGYFIVAEAGDTIARLEQGVGLPILRGLFDDLPFEHPDFSPNHDLLEAHKNETGCSIFEMVFISNDDGFATTLFIPDTEGIEGSLLALCHAYATPALTPP